MDDEYLVNRRSDSAKNKNIRKSAGTGPVSAGAKREPDESDVKLGPGKPSGYKSKTNSRSVFFKPRKTSSRIKEKSKRQRLSPNAKKILRYYAANAIVVLVFALIIGGLTAAIFSANLKSVKPDKYSDYTLIIGKKGDGVYYTHKLNSKYYRGGCVYVPLNEIAELSGFIITGDINELKYIAPNGYASFVLGTRYVSINGCSICLSDSTRGDYTDFLVPLDFVEHYIDGIEAVTDTEKRVITVGLIQPEEGGSDAEPQAVSVLYKLYSADDSENIDYNWLPESIKELTRDAVTETPDPGAEDIEG